MAADIARITYDPTRQYRAVVRQQGRVTLEADENEAATLAAEALRLETIDILGPATAIGDALLVGSANGPGGISLQQGIFYLGGWRLDVPQTLELPGDPNAADGINGNFAVALLLSEQSVGAVEDTALREVALGGPDTAARTRLMQDVVRLDIQGDGCADGQRSILSALGKQGVGVDPATCALVPTATLQAGFVPGQSGTDPCTPKAAGGYLGADNQMVRVTVIAFDPATNRGTLLWGWNNASLLYRAQLAGDATTLMLTTTPVDQEHAPQAQQCVEILKGELTLDTGNVIAAPQGVVTTVDQAYAFDTQDMTITPGLPPDYQSAPQLFVRLWQAAVEFTAGVAQKLDDVSGITVTIAMTALPDTWALRPYWRFSVRPNMPQSIYPARIAAGPVAPDGPRQWITELAVMTALPDGGSTLLRDCRTTYPAETSCCSLTLDPARDWRATLDAAIADPAVSVINVCLLAGTFQVTSTIAVSGKSVRMTGAGFASMLLGSALEVVIECDTCAEIVLSDLAVSAGVAGFMPNTGTRQLQGAITLRACTEIAIERVSLSCADADLRSASCLAIYHPAPPPGTVQPASPRRVTRVRDCRFGPGRSQAGILVTNADVALIEGNYIEHEQTPVGVTIDQLAGRPLIGLRLRKQVLHDMVLTSTAQSASRKAQARARKRAADAPSGASARKRGKAASATRSASVAAAPQQTPVPAGRAHVEQSFGNVRLKFLSSSTLTDTWTGALRASGLTETSTIGAVHKTVQQISRTMVTNPRQISPGAHAFVAALLPQLFSTAAQGIVIGGNAANDVRILNNTIDGMVQGIHVGLSNIKQFGPRSGHLSATRVQIKGNTVNISLSATDTLDRHGIYVGCVQSAVIADNHLTLARVPDAQIAWQPIDAIKVSGIFGPLMLIERNSMTGFSTGIYAQQNEPGKPAGVLWKAADNASDVANQIDASLFILTDNVD